MFDITSPQPDRSERWKRVAVVGSTLAVLIAGSLLALRSKGPKPVLPPVSPQSLADALREGAPEFEAYRKFVTIDNQSAVESENLLGQVTVVVRGVLHNRGQRDLTGVELRAVVSDVHDQIIAERIAVPVPKLRSKLAAGQSIVVHVNIDPVPREAVRTNGVILLRGLKFD